MFGCHLVLYLFLVAVYLKTKKTLKKYENATAAADSKFVIRRKKQSFRKF